MLCQRWWGTGVIIESLAIKSRGADDFFCFKFVFSSPWNATWVSGAANCLMWVQKGPPWLAPLRSGTSKWGGYAPWVLRLVRMSKKLIFNTKKCENVKNLSNSVNLEGW